jgi:hypothetical protein
MHKEEVVKRLQALEQALTDYMNQMKSIPSHLWMTQPEEGSWSAIQVTEHLLASERGTLGYMMKKSSGGWESLERTGEEQLTNSTKLNERLNSSERYAAPSILPQPENKMSAEEAEQHWTEIRSKLKAFAESVDPAHYDKLVFRQPAAGMLNILQTLEFLTLHMRHHIPQIERIAQKIK